MSILSQPPASDEPSLAERARKLVAAGRFGLLATHSSSFIGFPFASLMPYVADRAGTPIFFISALAMHTQNLQADWRASLLVTDPDSIGDPLAGRRVTLVGAVEQIEASKVAELYFDRHPDAREWSGFADFGFYALYATAIYFIGGFGVMGWTTPEEYIRSGRS